MIQHGLSFRRKPEPILDLTAAWVPAFAGMTTLWD